MSIYEAEKASERLTLEEWKSRNEQSICTTDKVLSNSVFERKDSALLRSETKIASKWDTYHNEDLLSDRISLVHEWLRNSQHSLRAVGKERMVLMEVKTYLEAYLNESLLPPLDVLAQCLHLRDQRQTKELTLDPVTSQLKEELQVYEIHKAQISILDADAWNMLGQLASLTDSLKFCISEQTTAVDLDASMMALKITSPCLALRPELQRVPPRSSAPDSWLDHSRELVKRQAQECTQSRGLRENILSAIEQARNGNRAQQEETGNSFRERIYEIKSSTRKLKKQREQIFEEMEKINKEINELEMADRSMDLPRALCETRHEVRSARPAGPQRCQDEPQDGLAIESLTLAESQKKLQRNTVQARAAYEALRVHLAKVEFDLEDKNAALALEMRCLSNREQLEKSDYQVTQSHSSQL